MSRFNTPPKSTKTRNKEGGVAFKMGAKEELYSAVVTTSLSDSYYEQGGDRLQRIIKLVESTDPEFVGKLAVYAREQMYLRSVPLVLATTLAKTHSGDNLVSKVVSRVVNRADEIAELLAYYAKANPSKSNKKLGKLSKQLQKGLQVAFNKFNEFQFAKYNRDGEVKLRDALFLVHPKAKNAEQQAIFDKITKGELKVPETWEVQSTQVGQQEFDSEEAKADAKKSVWEKLIAENKLGYMATLRNLRNMLTAGVSKETLSKVSKFLSDPEQVKKSKQFPFRFLSAHRELEGVGSFESSGLMQALEDALKASAANIPWIDDNSNIMIGCDLSGSMDDKLSERSSVKRMEVGAILAALLRQRCQNVMCGCFGQTFKLVNVPKGDVISTARKIAETDVGHSTNGHLVVEYMNQKGLDADKVLLFTDMQLWDSSGYDNSLNSAWNTYKKTHPNAKLYIFDLAGYGESPVSVLRDDVVYVAGWSDRIFSVLEALEKGSTAIKEIEKIVL